MKIIDRSESFQVLDDIADIILGIEFDKAIMNIYELVSTTAFITFDELRPHTRYFSDGLGRFFFEKTFFKIKSVFKGQHF